MDPLAWLEWDRLDELMRERFGDEWRETASIEDIEALTAELRRAAGEST